MNRTNKNYDGLFVLLHTRRPYINEVHLNKAAAKSEAELPVESISTVFNFCRCFDVFLLRCKQWQLISIFGILHWFFNPRLMPKLIFSSRSLSSRGSEEVYVCLVSLVTMFSHVYALDIIFPHFDGKPLEYLKRSLCDISRE